MSKDLGKSTSYAYYVAEGGTKTPQEYGEMLVNIDTVATRAEDAADAAAESATGALNSKNAAQTAATTATNKATETTTAAQTATAKAGEASTSASTATSAKDTAVSASQTATTKATEATTAAATATSAKTDAVAANTAAQSAKTAAQTAQTGAETAAASVQSSAAQIATNTEDIAQLKSDFANQTVVYNTILNKYIKSADGTIATYNGWDMTDYIPVMDRMLIYSPERNIYCWWYKSDKSPLSQQILLAGMNECNPPENAAYIAISNSRSVMGNTLVYNGAYIQSKHSADYAEILDKGVHFEETMNTTEGVALSTSLYPQGIIANIDYVVKYINSWGNVRSIYGLTLFGEGGMTQQYETITVFEPKTINVPFDVVKVDVYVASNVTANGTVTLTIDRKGLADIDVELQPIIEGNSKIDITTFGDALVYRMLLPSYYFDIVGAGTSDVGEYLSNKANSIKDDGVRFVFYTDSHYPRSVHDAEKLINYIRFRKDIKWVINGGDYIDKYSSKYNAMADMSKCINPMISAFGHAFLPVLGDHDNNTYGWSTPTEVANAMIPYTEIDKRLHAGLSPKVVTYNPIAKMETMSFYNAADRDEWIAYFANNYYVDDENEKVRYIVSNTGNIDGIQKTYFDLSTPSEVKLIFPWLYDALMTTPMGYSVVYACHNVVTQPNIMWLSSLACGMLGALKTKSNAYRVPKTPANSNLEEWFGDTNAWVFDFGDAPTIDKIVCVSGNAHEDFVVIIDSSTQTSDFWDGESTVSVSDGYVPIIVTQTDSFGAYDDGTTAPHVMTEDTVTEHCIDVVQVADDNIYITRIGAGDDRTIPIS